MKLIILLLLSCSVFAEDIYVPDPSYDKIDRELASVQDGEELIYNETENGEILYIEDEQLKEFGL